MIFRYFLSIWYVPLNFMHGLHKLCKTSWLVLSRCDLTALHKRMLGVLSLQLTTDPVSEMCFRVPCKAPSATFSPAMIGFDFTLYCSRIMSPNTSKLCKKYSGDHRKPRSTHCHGLSSTVTWPRPYWSSVTGLMEAIPAQLYTMGWPGDYPPDRLRDSIFSTGFINSTSKSNF